ncbi:MAG: class I SAM-dependent methyltransferase, partial [Alphaproteobacteria bacterium]|nr:class I SAM-dependent methyltransferase [Alphaproteobacteria bacterium]
DALRAVRVVEPFHNAVHVHLVETSGLLRVRQRENLARAGVGVEWHERMEDVPRGPAIIIANEFFDALPVRHFQRAGGAWHERMVGLAEDGSLRFGLAPVAETSIRAEAEDGTMLEIGSAAHRAMADIAARLVEDGGVILAIDYGHAETGFGETLQALKGHARTDPLAEPGEADITAHVDFASLARAARASGAAVYGPVTQANFLTSLGIFERAAGLKKRADARQALEIDRALLRLVSTGREMGLDGNLVPGMGALFKVLSVATPVLAPPPGFEASV